MNLVLINTEEGRKYDFVETIDPSIHKDITSIKAVCKFASSLESYDFMYAYTYVKVNVALSGGFTSLDISTKFHVATMAACTKEEALTVLSENDRFNYAIISGGKLKEARQKRIEKARQNIAAMVLSGDMSYSDSNSMLDDTKDLFNIYIEGANPALITWVNTEYVSKSYYNSEVKDMLIDIIVNGN